MKKGEVGRRENTGTILAWASTGAYRKKEMDIFFC